MEYHPNHYCEHCGCQYKQHKGGTDVSGPEDACPPTHQYGDFKPFDLDNPMGYWAKGKHGQFQPRR